MQWEKDTMDAGTVPVDLFWLGSDMYDFRGLITMEIGASKRCNRTFRTQVGALFPYSTATNTLEK